MVREVIVVNPHTVLTPPLFVREQIHALIGKLLRELLGPRDPERDQYVLLLRTERNERLNLIGYAIAVNSLALHRHRRTLAPPEQLAA